MTMLSTDVLMDTFFLEKAEEYVNKMEHGQERHLSVKPRRTTLRITMVMINMAMAMDMVAVGVTVATAMVTRKTTNLT